MPHGTLIEVYWEDRGNVAARECTLTVLHADKSRTYLVVAIDRMSERIVNPKTQTFTRKRKGKSS
jgi:hypothetical protein